MSIWPRVTHTRTVHAIDPANPYLTCDKCGAWVDHFSHTAEDEGPVVNEPCGHAAGATSACPSWSPVDGCCCAEHLGNVPHGQPEVVPVTRPAPPPGDEVTVECDWGGCDRETVAVRWNDSGEGIAAWLGVCWRHATASSVPLEQLRPGGHPVTAPVSQPSDRAAQLAEALRGRFVHSRVGSAEIHNMAAEDLAAALLPTVDAMIAAEVEQVRARVLAELAWVDEAEGPERAFRLISAPRRIRDAVS